MRNCYSGTSGLGLASASLLFVLCLVLVGCDRGEYDTPVDAKPRFGFDTTPVYTVDAPRPSGVDSGGAAGSFSVFFEGGEGFVAPPHPEYVFNRSASDDEVVRFGSKNAAKLWVWNRRGATKLFLAQGESASNSELGVEIELNSVGVFDSPNSGKVYLVLNGKPLPVLEQRQGCRSGEVYVFVSDVLVEGNRVD